MDNPRPTVFLGQRLMTSIAGSEVVTYELARYLSTSCHVLIGTFAFTPAWARRIDELTGCGLYLWDDPDLNARLSENPPSLAWVHHGVIPAALLRAAASVPFVFHHMSPFSVAERPLIRSVEEALAARVVFPAQDSLSAFLKEQWIGDLPADRFMIFGNPAPSEFSLPLQTRPTKPARVLVVSNHPPTEVLDLPGLLPDIAFRMIGNKDDSLSDELVTPQDLSDTDAVITIGKTVQYALASGVPTYCYDHFGGPGWLTMENFELARAANFSGRDHPVHRSPQQIADDLHNRYQTAVADLAQLHQIVQSDLMLPEAWDRVTTGLKPTGNTLTERSISDYLGAETVLADSVKSQSIASASVTDLLRTDRELWARVNQAESRNSSLELALNEFEANARQEEKTLQQTSDRNDLLSTENARLRAIKNSQEVRLALRLARPLRRLLRRPQPGGDDFDSASDTAS